MVVLNFTTALSNVNGEIVERYSYDAFGKTTGDVWSFTTVQAPEIIEINSDITTNQIWTANNVYYVTNDVNVQALLVIEPGTLVIFSYGRGLFVNNGGTLISKGTPDKPIIYTCDFYLDCLDEIGYYWWYIYYYGYGSHYYSPIYIEETASPATTVTYSFIEGAVVGIATVNITLDHPIENNYLFGNIYGIGEYGTKHTDIKNNLCFFNVYTGIDVHLADANDTGDANSHILIQNNTCSWQYYDGITVHGVADSNDMGLVMLVNNIVTESYWYGLNLVDGYMMFDVSNTGYGGNGHDGNGGNKNREFKEYNPVETTQNPYRYIEGGDYFDICYLDPSCVFINAGLGYIDETPLIGRTTAINGTPDSNFVDLGFHHPNWNYSNEPNIIPTISGVSGYVQMSIDVTDPRVCRVFALIDGEFYGEFSINMEGYSSTMGIKTEKFSNGQHSIKIVSLDIDGNAICSRPVQVIFNNELNSVTMSKGYEIGKPYYLYAFGAPSTNYIVEVNDRFNSTIVYSANFTGNIQAVIPPEAFAANSLMYRLTIRDSSNPESLKFSETVGKAFKKEDYGANSPAKMVITVGSADLETDCEEVIKAVVAAGKFKFDTNDIVYLTYNYSTWDNAKHALQLPYVKIWVHFGHGNYTYLWGFNQIVEFNGEKVSALNSWWYRHSIEELGFKENPKLNFVFFHSCYGARTTQFAYALGILPSDDPYLIGTRAFISWYGTAYHADSFEYYNEYLVKLWNELSYGSTLYDAKDEAEDGIRGGYTISANMVLLGVSTDQKVWFAYPNITSPGGH